MFSSTWHICRVDLSSIYSSFIPNAILHTYHVSTLLSIASQRLCIYTLFWRDPLDQLQIPLQKDKAKDWKHVNAFSMLSKLFLLSREKIGFDPLCSTMLPIARCTGKSFARELH